MPSPQKKKYNCKGLVAQIQVRVNPARKAGYTAAATIQGKTLTAFLLDAADKAAVQTLAKK